MSILIVDDGWSSPEPHDSRIAIAEDAVYCRLAMIQFSKFDQVWNLFQKRQCGFAFPL